jgi:hypothetical protein
LIDCENGESETEERILCALEGISPDQLYKKSDEEIETIANKAAELPLMYCNDPIDIQSLQRELSGFYSQNGRKKMMLVLDSLQAVQSDLQNLRLTIDEWLIHLDRLKLQYDGQLVVLLTCEKARGKYGVATKEGGKESGRIEYKLEQQLDLRYDGEEIVMECTKNRHGPKGEPIYFEKVLTNPADKWSFTFTLRESDRREMP